VFSLPSVINYAGSADIQTDASYTEHPFVRQRIIQSEVSQFMPRSILKLCAALLAVTISLSAIQAKTLNIQAQSKTHFESFARARSLPLPVLVVECSLRCH
jgi:hypothetical protein